MEAEQDRTVRTSAEWAYAIRAKLEKTVEGIVETGQLLGAAKADLGHGGFLAMLRDHLKISPDRAEQYMRIARDPVLRDSANWRNLPASRSALDVLANLDEGLKLAALEDGRIHAAMTAAVVRRLGAAAPLATEAWEGWAAVHAAMDRLLRGCPLKDVGRVLSAFTEKGEEVQRAYGEPLSDDDRAALDAMRGELKEAEPGHRFLQCDDVGKVISALRQPATYPRWMGWRRTRTAADRKIRAIDKLLDGHAAGLLGMDLLARARLWGLPQARPDDLAGTPSD